ncbi:hypothetical protein PR003_g35035, partial [Phytophthora rubi]
MGSPTRRAGTKFLHLLRLCSKLRKATACYVRKSRSISRASYLACGDPILSCTSSRQTTRLKKTFRCYVATAMLCEFSSTWPGTRRGCAKM